MIELSSYTIETEEVPEADITKDMAAKSINVVKVLSENGLVEYLKKNKPYS